MMARKYMVTDGNLLAMGRRLMEQGEITIEQYGEMLRRARESEEKELGIVA